MTKSLVRFTIKSLRRSKKIYFLLAITLLIVIVVYTTNTYSNMTRKYKKLLKENYKFCLSLLAYEKNINLYYKFIDLINKYENAKENMFSKSQISVKISNFGTTKDEIIRNFSELAQYAKDNNVFIWMAALYQKTVDVEYSIYKTMCEKYDNIGLTLSCSHSSMNDRVDEILKNNGHVRLVKGLYKGDITDDKEIKRIYVENANKLCNSNTYQCICTHDFNIINNLNLYHNKNLELSFYYTNFKYVQKNLKKYNIKVEKISFYSAYGNKFKGLFHSLSEFKLSYYDKNRLLLSPFNYLLN